MIKVVSWNVNSVRIRMPIVWKLIEEEDPDVILLQELKCLDIKFPKIEGYHCYVFGQKAYNGVAILSKKPLKDIERFGVEARGIKGVLGDLCIMCVYVPCGDGGIDKYDYKRRFLSETIEWIAAMRARYEKVVIGGDFNVAITDADVEYPEEYVGSVVCRPDVRSLMDKITELVSDVISEEAKEAAPKEIKIEATLQSYSQYYGTISGLTNKLYSTDGVKFSWILSAWGTGTTFTTSTAANQAAYIIGGQAYRGDLSTTTNVFKTSSAAGAKYLYVSNGAYWYSTDGTNYSPINPTTAVINTAISLPVVASTYSTSKPGVITTTSTKVANTVYYYGYNGNFYSSTDFVKFTNTSSSTDIIYYLDSNQVVPASVVTTDSNGVMWTTIGLMTMQVYNPMNFIINYNGNSYTLYCNTSILLMSNGVYKNNSTTAAADYVYQYNNNWYYSTDMLTFSKINFNAANTTATGVDSSSKIYLYNNLVLTSTPPTQTISDTTYWQFGIMLVNQTDITKCSLYYNSTVYSQATAANSYAPGVNFTRYTPTFISTGTLFSAASNTILFYPGLGFIVVTTPNSVANLVKKDGTIDSTNIYANLEVSQGLMYSSNSGYFRQENIFLSTSLNHKFTDGNYLIQFCDPNHAQNSIVV
jgi:exodeoxyribonuclease-3